MFVFMLVYLIHWLAGGSADDHAWIPLWGSFAIVGGLFILTGGVLFLIAKNKVNQINVVPRRTVETMKENVQWIKNQT
jgi:hypothetical protein